MLNLGKDPEECYKIISEILVTVEDTNNNIIDVSENLNIILLNLQIEAAHIVQKNGVAVIAKELRKRIIEMESSIKNTLLRRDELRSIMSMIIRYLNDYVSMAEEVDKLKKEIEELKSLK